MRLIMLPKWVVVLAAIHLTASAAQTTESAEEYSTVTSATTTPDYGKKTLRSRGSIKYATIRNAQEPKPFQHDVDAKKKAYTKKAQKQDTLTYPDASAAGNEMNINETVLEVEKYLDAHPDLPKLSREEIIDYIHNISDAKDEEMADIKYESQKVVDVKDSGPRESADRSIMVVLPFKAESEDIEELYTKSPLVKYLEVEESTEGINSEREEMLKGLAPEHRVVAYPVYKTTTEDYVTTTDATVKTYTTYNDAEMVTKRYYFEEPKHDNTGSNHKYEEEITTEDSLKERVKGPIIVLPVKSNFYGTEKGDGVEATTLKPKPFFRKRVKTTTEKPVKVDAGQQDSLENFDFVEATSTAKPFKVRKGTKGKTSTTTNGPPTREELNKVLEILPPDMKDLLSDLELNDKRVVADASGKVKDALPQPSIDPSSYAAFKPLPGGRKTEKFVDDGMKDFLASFGLLSEKDVQARRREKALEAPKDNKFIDEAPDVSLEMIPEDMRHILHNLGLARQPKTKQSRDHIFNPSNHSLNQSQEEVEKLKALMSSIKKIVNLNDSEPVSSELQKEIIQQIEDLDNLTLKYKNRQSTEMNDEIKQIIITNKSKFNFVPLDKINKAGRGRSTFGEGPDPLFVNEGKIKNEVKRQVSSSSSSSSSSGNGDSSSASSAAESDSGSSVTTTEEPPNIEGLRASFGGGETAPDDADIDSALPPKKPNGLYLLLDWNSFLEVGTEDDKRRVNIRFQPKIGDGRHFLPVTIP